MNEPGAGPQRVRSGFIVALVIAGLALALSAYHINRGAIFSSAGPAPPTPTPTPRPHFALDDVNLGPDVRLTRFIPDFDIYQDEAIEGADGLLVIAYYPDRPPSNWGFTGGEATHLGILNDGRIRPIDVSADKVLSQQDPNPGLVSISGLKDGKPVAQVMDGSNFRYVAIENAKVRRLPSGRGIVKPDWPCIPFDGGKMCEESLRTGYAVSFRSRDRRTWMIAGQPYSDVWLVGGGRHRFLIVEYHNMEAAAECLEGYAP